MGGRETTPLSVKTPAMVDQQQQQQPIKSITQSFKIKNGTQTQQLIRAKKLRNLLTTNNQREKEVLRDVTGCIKFIHQNYDIEWFKLRNLYETILKEQKGSNKQPA